MSRMENLSIDIENSKPREVCAKQTMCTSYDSGKEDFNQFLTLDLWLEYSLETPCIYWCGRENKCNCGGKT